VGPRARWRFALAALATALGCWCAALAQSPEHVVAPGETLSSIAARYDTSVDALRSRNDLTGDLLRIGQVLALPETPVAPAAAGWRIVAAASDASWTTLASRFSLPAELLRNANPAIPDPAGRSVRVPPGVGALATPLTGEDLIAFAARVGVAPGAVVVRNRLEPPYRLVAGEPLLLPGESEVFAAEVGGAAGTGVGGGVVGGGVVGGGVVAAPHELLREPAFARLASVLANVRLEPPDDEFAWPLAGFPRLTSRFGWRNVSVAGNRYHLGVDLGAASGTPVVASRGGTVVRAEWIGAYGFAVYLDHGDGFETRYAHLSRIDVTVGERLARGETVGRVGSTGASTGPHLHFEVRQHGSARDPLEVLPTPAGAASSAR